MNIRPNFPPRRLLLSGALLLLSVGGRAALPDSTLTVQRESEMNRLYNLRHGSMNPVRLNGNVVRDFGYGAFGYHWQQGDYHAVDASGHADAFDIDLRGQRRLGRFDVEGHITYLNSTERARKWNSTLFLPTDNPYVLGDSIASDVTTEAFDLGVTAAVPVTSRLILGLDARMLTGSMADQTDPRPKTDATHITLTPGVEVAVSDRWHLGLALGVDIYRANTTHAVVNNYINYRYFLMKGLGDYMRQSTGDQSSYPREYKGETYSAAVQLIYAPKQGRVANFLEARFDKGGENAYDGGSAYTFRGGDYSRTRFRLNERLQIAGESARHDFRLSADYAQGRGNWYDQQKLTDTEHGNLGYYVILSKNLMYKSTDLAARFEYEATLLHGRLPWLRLTAGLSADRSERKHFEAETLTQSYTRATFYAAVAPSFALRGWQLSARLHGSYTMPVGTRSFAAYASDIAETYTAPDFEFRSARQAVAGGALEALIPLTGKGTGLRVFADCTGRFFLGEGEYSPLLDGSSRLSVNTGIGLTF